MPRMDKLSPYNTTVHTDDEAMTHVIYHKTPIVSFRGKLIKLRSGGWRTVTTKRKMNQASNQFNLGYSVFQKDFTMLINNANKYWSWVVSGLIAISFRIYVPKNNYLDIDYSPFLGALNIMLFPIFMGLWVALGIISFYEWSNKREGVK